MRAFTHRSIPLVLTLALTVTAVGCIRTYKLDIQQGNVVTAELVSQLQLGMTRREVQYILGTPLVTDPFHVDRWDYFFTRKQGGATTREQRLITVVFKDDKLDRVEGSANLQTVAVSEVDAPPDSTTINSPDQNKPGMFKRLWSKIRRPKE